MVRVIEPIRTTVARVLGTIMRLLLSRCQQCPTMMYLLMTRTGTQPNLLPSTVFFQKHQSGKYWLIVPNSRSLPRMFFMMDIIDTFLAL